MTENPTIPPDRPDDDSERKRLELLQESLDSRTAQRLERIKIAQGWRCLEVGAGRGSIARLLAARAGSSGRVVATDNASHCGD